MGLTGSGQTQTKISDPARASIPDQTFNEKDTPPSTQETDIEKGDLANEDAYEEQTGNSAVNKYLKFAQCYFSTFCGL